MRTRRLPNWGFCGRQDSGRPDPEACGVSLSGQFSALWWGEDAVTEPITKPDPADAEILDAVIRQMPDDHKRIIKRSFYLCNCKACTGKYGPHMQGREDVDRAIRALFDVMDANRVVVQRMRQLRAA
jgi:hypothetical protein